MSPPRAAAGGSEGAAPPAPQRSAASQLAAKNFTSRMIRLIDDESDSDPSCQSDSYEEHFVFQTQPTPRRPLLAGGQVMTSPSHLVMTSPLQVVTPQAPQEVTTTSQPQLVIASPMQAPAKTLSPQTQLVMTSPIQVMTGAAQNVTSASQIMTAPAQVMPSSQVLTQVMASPAQQLLSPVQQPMVVTQAATSPAEVTNSVRNDDVVDDENIYEFYGNLEESLNGPPMEGGPEEEAAMSGSRELVARRGGSTSLMHSVSAPAVLRPLRRHQRAPGLAVPPPLDHLSEEEVGASDYEEYEQIPRPSLHRTDSVVTVAHLYEDLLVSSRFRLRVTLTNLTAVVVVAALVVPNTSTILYTVFRLVFGTLFPAYYSYKAVKTKNVKEYVKWMMYWIVFAFFTCFETLTDLFLSFWFPFYYELKILVVLWLLSPATRGSSILYRKFVHPWLTRREDDIDNCIAQAKQQGYSTVIQLGTKGVNYATTVLMQTAIKASQGPQGGGGLVNQLRRSYSSGELADGDMNRNVKALPHIPDDDYDDHTHSSGSYEAEPRTRAESDAAYKPRGSSASRVVRSNKTRSADVSDVYYQDVPDETIQRRRSPRTQDTARSQPTLHFQEPQVKGQPRKRGKSENRPRPKSMISAADVTRGAEWARAQRVGSTMSLNSEVELSESSSHSSIASIASSAPGQHSVRPKTRTGSTRRARVDSQGRKGTGSTSRSSSRAQPTVIKKSSLEAGSESE
ncbi:uncharacterized protein [Panulirus ornatus]|uniref:uncharacterized protein isoform X4 n=1 Tax=Panulirus ornatus TaxID=150431 RepID=UPI003A84A6E8